MTDREKAIVMAHTGTCMFQGEKIGEFYKYLEELYGRPVYTHEIVYLDFEEKSKADFIKLCLEEQPEPCEDTISRQAAIYIASGYCHPANIAKELAKLPSAQPEIIRCKNCLMHGVCRFEQGLGLDGYCSQAKRREDG